MTEDEIIITQQVTVRLSRKQLRAERAILRDQKNMTEPTNAELRDLGKLSHPYYTRDLVSINARIAEITEILQEI